MVAHSLLQCSKLIVVRQQCVPKVQALLPQYTVIYSAWSAWCKKRNGAKSYLPISHEFLKLYNVIRLTMKYLGWNGDHLKYFSKETKMTILFSKNNTSRDTVTLSLSLSPQKEIWGLIRWGHPSKTWQNNFLEGGLVQLKGTEKEGCKEYVPNMVSTK